MTTLTSLHPVGTRHLAGVDTAFNGTDIDLYVYRDGELVGLSAEPAAEEAVTTTTAGTYDIYLVQYASHPAARSRT